MSEYDPALKRLFAPARALEPTEDEISDVLKRVATEPPVGRRGRRRADVSAGAVLAAFAVASTLAIGGLAIVLLGRGSPHASTASAPGGSPHAATAPGAPGGSPHGSTAPGAPSGARQQPGVSALLTQNFAVFRRPPRSQPPLPSRIASGFSPSFDRHWGFNPARTQYIALTRGIRIWLVPGTQSVCMVQSGPVFPLGSSSCTSVENAVRPGFPWVGEPAPGNRRAWIGLVPDGATVTVTTRTGAIINVPIVDNVGYVTSSSGFRNAQIGWTTSCRYQCPKRG